MWTYALLPHILNMSLTAGIVIVLVLVARLLLKKAPKIFSYALWAVVLFRLVCPVSFSSQFSLIGLFNTPMAQSGSTYSSNEYIPADIVHAESPQVSLPLEGVSEAINEKLPQGEEQLAADSLEWPVAAATVLWLSGIAAMLIYSAMSLIRLRRKLIGAVRLRDNIYLADHIASPFVIGVIRPKIYLPSTLPEEECSYVILHEQTHIRRLDHIIKMLAFLALALHWFNPLVWAAFVFAVKDMEMSCDERVLKQMGGGIRGAYSASLLSLATGRRLISGSPLAFGEGNIKGRIRNIMNFKKPAAWVVVASFLAVVIAAVCLLANPAYLPDTSPPGTEHNVLVAYVDETLSEPEARALQSTIEQNPNVEYAEFVTREEAWTNIEALYEDKSALEGLDASVLHHRYYVYIRDTSQIEQTANDILNIAGIIKINVGLTNNISDEAPVSASVTAAEPLIFTSEETDLIKLGTLAFETYMDYRMSEKTPAEERIASFELNDISILAGDINEFCVAVNYDITTDSDSYLNPALGAQGKGTWTDNYMEIRVKYAYDNVYSIKGIGTGGGAQGLAPYVSEPSGTGELITQADVNQDGKEENIYLDKSEMETTFIVTILVTDQSGNEIWSEALNTAHAGWDQIFLCNYQGAQYLLRYTPHMGQGYCTYAYSLFSPNKGGQENAILSNTLEFDINGDKALDAGKMVDFADEVNALLKTSTLLISSDGGAWSFGPASAEPFYERFSWIDGMDAEVSPDESLETKLAKYSDWAVNNRELSELLYNAYTNARSDKFSREEIRDAMESVIVKFRDFNGCKLENLWYDEEKSNNQIESYMTGGHGSINGVSKDNVIVLYSDFTVDSSGGDGSLEPNSTYTNWCWILIRDSGAGEWRVDDWGY